MDDAPGADWELVADLVGDVEPDAFGQTLDVGAPGATEAALSRLSDEEQEELVRLIRAELEKGRPS